MVFSKKSAFSVKVKQIEAYTESPVFYEKYILENAPAAA